MAKIDIKFLLRNRGVVCKTFFANNHYFHLKKRVCGKTDTLNIVDKMGKIFLRYPYLLLQITLRKSLPL